MLCYCRSFNSSKNQQANRRDCDVYGFVFHAILDQHICDSGTLILLHLAHLNYAHPKAPRVHKMPYPTFPIRFYLNVYCCFVFLER